MHMKWTLVDWNFRLSRCYNSHGLNTLSDNHFHVDEEKKGKE